MVENFYNVIFLGVELLLRGGFLIKVFYSGFPFNNFNSYFLIMNSINFSKLSRRTVGWIGVFLCIITAFTAYAQKNITLSLGISAGNLTVEVRNSSGSKDTIDAPDFDLGDKTVSNAGQTFASPIPGSGQEIFISNLDAADGGWNLAIAPTTGVSARWQLEDADSTVTVNDSVTGLMTIDPGGGTLTPACITGCSISNITLGTSASFSATVSSVTLLTAADAADDIGTYTLTGVNVSQTVPGNLEPGDYSLGMTLTIATT